MSKDEKRLRLYTDAFKSCWYFILAENKQLNPLSREAFNSSALRTLRLIKRSPSALHDAITSRASELAWVEYIELKNEAEIIQALEHVLKVEVLQLDTSKVAIKTAIEALRK